jgi:hypothetical protein
MSSSVLQPLLDSSKVARLLGIEVETLAAWRRKNYGPRWYRLGRNVRYTETDLRLWMNGQAQRAVSPPGDSPGAGRATDTEAVHDGRSSAETLGGRR